MCVWNGSCARPLTCGLKSCLGRLPRSTCAKEKRAHEVCVPPSEGILMSLGDQREDGLHRHGKFSCSMLFQSQTSKDREQRSFVSVAGVLRCYQRSVSSRSRMLESILGNADMPICAVKDLRLLEWFPQFVLASRYGDKVHSFSHGPRCIKVYFQLKLQHL